MESRSTLDKKLCATCYVIAKFHYTGPTGPDPTRADQHGPERPKSPRNSVGLCGSRTKSVRVGSGRARVVEFSL